MIFSGLIDTATPNAKTPGRRWYFIHSHEGETHSYFEVLIYTCQIITQ